MKPEKDRQEIKKIAKSVRTWTESIQRQHQLWPENLMGLCAIASVELYKRLRKNKFKPVFCLAEDSWEYGSIGHVFITCNNYIVDVTATQFGDHKIVVRKISRCARSARSAWWWWHLPVIECCTLRELKDKLIDWPNYQHPVQWKKCVGLKHSERR